MLKRLKSLFFNPIHLSRQAAGALALMLGLVVIILLGWDGPKPSVPEKLVTMRFFEKPLSVREGVFYSRIVQATLLPFMENHPELFKDKTVLDIGTGSGVLALYAAKLGAKKVIATDINREAIANVMQNARQMGYDNIIEARLVPLDDRRAFSVMKPGERFDTIISNPPFTLDINAKSEISAVHEDGTLAISLIEGLRERLAPQGHAVLLYDSFLSHQIVSRLARKRGYIVRMHMPDSITPYELDVAFQTYTQALLAHMGLPENEIQMVKILEPLPLPERFKQPLPLLEGSTAPEKVYYPGVIVISVPSENSDK